MRALTDYQNRQPNTGITRTGIQPDRQVQSRLQALPGQTTEIAHDINNLLGDILGNISLAMLQLNSSNEPYEFLEHAEDALMKTRKLTLQLQRLDPQREDSDHKD